LFVSPANFGRAHACSVGAAIAIGAVVAVDDGGSDVGELALRARGLALSAE
jgi:hypothetical protein